MERPLPRLPGAGLTEVHVLGIRHHGPGSARAVARALDELRPDRVVIEGPPELDALVGFVASPALEPPVAALVYVEDEPKRASFYPMAAFSPEWVALRWAAAAGVPAQFADLPATNLLADDEAEARNARRHRERDDPLAVLAAAAGYDDPERWWEDAVEHRYHGLDVFSAVLDAMRLLRAGGENGDSDNDNDRDVFEERREASMRRVLRAVVADGPARVAVVCGAWHAPVLVPEAWPRASVDTAVLKGLPKVKVQATWVPWTSARLARASGYGAGVTSPGWYHHLFTSPDEAVVPRWMVKVAKLLREEELDASPASVIEAVRLAEGLAGLRGRPLAGLTELTEATRAVLCGGSDVPLRIVAERLLVGDQLGAVPDDVPMVPLARDLARHQKRLRLKVSASSQLLELDLRTASHLERSTLFHRLLALDVDWAQPAVTGRTRGTFREAWELQWRPELSVALVEASGAGTTIEAAADSTIRQRASEAEDLATLTELVEQALLAELPAAVAATMAALAERAAHQHDTPRLMAAVEPLARIRRYGDVRGADTSVVHDVLDGMLTRIAVGLPAACASLDDDAARQMHGLVDTVQRAVSLVDEPVMREQWQTAVGKVADQRGVHGLVAGRCVRLLLDAGVVSSDDAATRLSLSLSRASDPVDAAAWVEGFLTGDASLLVHDRALLGVLDGWIVSVAGDVFDDLVPLLRRSFSEFSAAERRMIGEHVRRLGGGTPGGHRPATATDIDRTRADRVLPVLQRLLGGGS